MHAMPILAFTWPVTLYFPLVHNISKCSTDRYQRACMGNMSCLVTSSPGPGFVEINRTCKIVWCPVGSEL